MFHKASLNPGRVICTSSVVGIGAFSGDILSSRSLNDHWEFNVCFFVILAMWNRLLFIEVFNLLFSKLSSIKKFLNLTSSNFKIKLIWWNKHVCSETAMFCYFYSHWPRVETQRFWTEAKFVRVTWLLIRILWLVARFVGKSNSVAWIWRNPQKAWARMILRHSTQ